MAEDSVFVNGVQFLDKIGLYDVVLPFLLVFTIVYAILEKSKIFGTEEYQGKEVTKRNLNSMTAFVIAFLVVASTNLVASLNEAVANIVLLLVLSFSFLLLIGSFMKPEDMKEGVFLEGWWKTLFMVIMFIGVALIFLHALKTSDPDWCPDDTPCNWLDIIWDFLESNWDSSFVGSIFLLLILGGFIAYLTYERKDDKKDDS